MFVHLSSQISVSRNRGTNKSTRFVPTQSPPSNSASGTTEEEGPDARRFLKGRRGEDAARQASDWVLFQSSGEEVLKAGNAQEAITFFTQAILCKPPDSALAQLHLSRAKAFQTIGQFTKSRADCVKVKEERKE